MGFVGDLPGDIIAGALRDGLTTISGLSIASIVAPTTLWLGVTPVDAGGVAPMTEWLGVTPGVTLADAGGVAPITEWLGVTAADVGGVAPTTDGLGVTAADSVGVAWCDDSDDWRLRGSVAADARRDCAGVVEGVVDDSRVSDVPVVFETDADDRRDIVGGTGSAAGADRAPMVSSVWTRHEMRSRSTATVEFLLE